MIKHVRIDKKKLAIQEADEMMPRHDKLYPRKMAGNEPYKKNINITKKYKSLSLSLFSKLFFS